MRAWPDGRRNLRPQHPSQAEGGLRLLRLVLPLSQWNRFAIRLHGTLKGASDARAHDNFKVAHAPHISLLGSVDPSAPVGWRLPRASAAARTTRSRTPRRSRVRPALERARSGRDSSARPGAGDADPVALPSRSSREGATDRGPVPRSSPRSKCRGGHDGSARFRVQGTSPSPSIETAFTARSLLVAQAIKSSQNLGRPAGEWIADAAAIPRCRLARTRPRPSRQLRPVRARGM